jgi:hypothetical protein
MMLLVVIALANGIHAGDVECDVKNWRELAKRSKGLVLATYLKPGMSYEELTRLLGKPDWYQPGLLVLRCNISGVSAFALQSQTMLAAMKILDLWSRCLA